MPAGSRSPSPRLPAALALPSLDVPNAREPQTPERPDPSTVLTPVPSSHLRARTSRAMAVLVADHQVVKQLMREMKTRAGLTDAEIARRMGINRQAVTEVQNSFETTDHKRRVSLVWFTKYAAVCGARLLVEFGENQHA